MTRTQDRNYTGSRLLFRDRACLVSSQFAGQHSRTGSVKPQLISEICGFSMACLTIHPILFTVLFFSSSNTHRWNTAKAHFHDVCRRFGGHFVLRDINPRAPSCLLILFLWLFFLVLRGWKFPHNPHLQAVGVLCYLERQYALWPGHGIWILLVGNSGAQIMCAGRSTWCPWDWNQYAFN